MKILELFAGSRSIGKAAEELGMEVYSSDITPFENIHYVVDIMDFDIDKLPFKPDVIRASPPCQWFSVAVIGRNWNRDYTPKTDSARLGLSLLDRTLEIISKIRPTYRFIENPRGMMRKMPQMQKLIRHTVTYCQYGDKRQKPTDIWTNSTKWKPKSACNRWAPCHEAAPRWSRTGTQWLKWDYERSKIPHELCKEILLSCKE